MHDNWVQYDTKERNNQLKSRRTKKIAERARNRGEQLQPRGKADDGWRIADNGGMTQRLDVSKSKAKQTLDKKLRKMREAARVRHRKRPRESHSFVSDDLGAAPMAGVTATTGMAAAAPAVTSAAFRLTTRKPSLITRDSRGERPSRKEEGNCPPTFRSQGEGNRVEGESWSSSLSPTVNNVKFEALSPTVLRAFSDLSRAIAVDRNVSQSFFHQGATEYQEIKQTLEGRIINFKKQIRVRDAQWQQRREEWQRETLRAINSAGQFRYSRGNVGDTSHQKSVFLTGTWTNQSRGNLSDDELQGDAEDSADVFAEFAGQRVARGLAQALKRAMPPPRSTLLPFRSPAQRRRRRGRITQQEHGRRGTNGGGGGGEGHGREDDDGGDENAEEEEEEEGEEEE